MAVALLGTFGVPDVAMSVEVDQHSRNAGPQGRDGLGSCSAKDLEGSQARILTSLHFWKLP